MDIRFDGRVAVVTGAGAGLGKSHALTLASRGAKVVVNDPAPPATDSADRPADRVVAEIKANGGEAVANYGSVMDEGEAKAIIDQAVDTYGRIDVLINNAGFLRDKSFAKMPMSEFDVVLKVHLAGSAYCTSAAWQHMKAAGYGRVVFTTSNSGLYGNFGQANYAAAKAGVVGLMNAIKQEGVKAGIMVNTIAPMAATPMTENVMDADTKAAFDPTFVSAAVAFLCSENFTESGCILSAAGGHLAAVRVVSSSGILLDRNQAGSPEVIADRWKEIQDLSNFQTFGEAGEEMRFIVSAIQEKARASTHG